MIEVYAFSTPNSIRVPIALEELGLDYKLKPINVRKGEQKRPDYLAINPNGKVPLLVDSEGLFPWVKEGAALTYGLVYLVDSIPRPKPADLPKANLRRSTSTSGELL